MKKYLFLILAAATLLAVSCQKENAGEQAGNDVAVLTVSLPQGIVTKAISDGTSATELHWAVYDGNGKFLKENDTPLTINLQTEVQIKLVKNYAYDIVFWAQAPGAPYTIDWANKTITVDNYTSDANDESRDAFYQVVEDYRVVSTPTEVKLYRPFAQINFGASDYKDVQSLIGDTMQSTIEVSGLPDVLNVLDKTATRSTTEGATATFTKTNVPAISGEKLEINGDKEKYGYVSMNYVLAPQDKTDIVGGVKGTFYYNNANVVIDVPNVPYQRNYRTNIIGELFSGPAVFNVIIVPVYEEPDENIYYPEVTVAYDSNKGFSAQIGEIAAGNEANVVLDLGNSGVEWTTGAGIGSTPLVDEESVVETFSIENGTFTATGSGVGAVRLANGGTLIFKNTKIVDQSVSYAENSWEYGYLEMGGRLEFYNCEFVNAIQISGDAYFYGCTFNSNKENEYDVWVDGGKAVFENCTFSGYRGLKMHEAYGSEVKEVLVDGCTFGPLSKKPGIAIGTVNADTKVSVIDSKFVDCQPGDQGLYIYETDTDVTTFDFTQSGNTVENN